MDHGSAPDTPGAAPADEIRAALQSVLQSAEFAGAGRLKDFLDYAVRRDLDGRAADLRAKIIAVDVYGRKSGDADAEALVRVDAGRLRRRLDLYYAGSGAEDQWRIYIDKGGYAPRYDLRPALPKTPGPEPDMPRPANRARRWRAEHSAIAGLSATCLLLTALSVHLWQAGMPMETAAQPGTAALDRDALLTRQVLFEENPARLQALNLVEQGHTMLLPAPDRYRIESALGLFTQAVRLDPDSPGGYAGIALGTAIMGALMPKGQTRDMTLERSRKAAAEAMRRDPTDPLSLTAQALSAFAGKEDATALDRIGKAASLAPEDVHVRDYHALITLFLGELGDTLEVTDPRHYAGRPYQRLAWRNARASALYLTGRADEAIDLLTEAAALGDPVSIINHAVLAASYQKTGQGAKARETVIRFRSAWPDQDVARLLTGLFRDPDHAASILDALREAGWS